MALLDILKKKKPKRKTEKKIAEKSKPEKKEVKEEKQILETKPRAEKKTTAGAYYALKEPHVTEKATDLAAKNQYVFKILPRANKTEIKKAVENTYGVDVLSVRIINIPRKQRRVGKIEGFKKGYRKAIVKIKEGQKIEVMPR